MTLVSEQACSSKLVRNIPLTGFEDQSILPTLISDAQLRISFEDLFNEGVDRTQIVPVGLLSEGNFTYHIRQQPANNYSIVYSEPDVLTLFKLADIYGTVGLLAHSNLAGSSFNKLSPGTLLELIYGNMSIVHYRVTSQEYYQVLQSDNPTSDLLTLDGHTTRLSAADLFLRIYGIPDRLVLQTCIEKYNNAYWGRLFIIAEPLDQTGLIQ
jgi:hypothetical protein